MRFAYADPPYPGRAHLYPEQTEVDHAELIDRLIANYPDGWALSTDSRGLWEVLPILRPHRDQLRARLAIWHTPDAAPFGSGHPRGRDSRIAWAFEVVLFAGGRGRPGPNLTDLATIPRPERGRGFVGQKPAAFGVWICRLLGVERGDQVDDLFPGSGAFGRAVESYQMQWPLPNPPRHPQARRSGKLKGSRGWRSPQDELVLEGETSA